MTAVIVLVIMGLVLGFVIGIAVKLFGTDQDPRLEQIEELLPNANCGACGFAGCADFARALVAGKANPGQCPSSDSHTVTQICTLLGVAATKQEPKVAVVMCGGDNVKALKAARYNGVNSCRDAMLVANGDKACAYGCLGFGDCARACPFGAMEITEQGIAVVHADLCSGCGQCVTACPRNIIKLVPRSAPVHVLCSSPEKGAAKMKVCKAACIGCRKCVKGSEDGQMQMDGFLAKVNYDNPPPASVADLCPTKALQASTSRVTAKPETEKEVEVVNG